MNLDYMRTWVRGYLDLDEEDLSDVLFDEFAEEGTAKILEREANWPFLESSASLVPSIGVATYDTALTFPDLQFLTGIQVEADFPYDLTWTSYRSRNAWPTEGATLAWTEYGGQVHFFPAPTTTDSLTITGVLKVTGWTAGGPGAEPPLPEPFHGLVLKWTLSATYAQQDDPDNSLMHAAEFDKRLEQLWRRYMTEPRAEGIRIGSRRSRPPWPEPVLPSGF